MSLSIQNLNGNTMWLDENKYFVEIGIAYQGPMYYVQDQIQPGSKISLFCISTNDHTS